MMKLRINPLVAKNLKSIKDYIAEDNADKALETIQEIYSQFENIQQFPYIGVDLTKRVSFKTVVLCQDLVQVKMRNFSPF